MSSPYIMRIASQKGGVGKTTIAVNLGVLLSLANYNVLLADCDGANPSVGFHLGMEQANLGYKDVVNGKASLQSATAIHAPSGLRVLPGTVGAYAFTPKPENLRSFVQGLTQTKNDFVIIDTAPGFTESEPLELYNEALLITTPEMAACTSIMRLARIYTKSKLKHNLVINRVRNKRYEFSVDEIEDMYENKAIAVIPEDDEVPISVSEHIPAVVTAPKSVFSVAMKTMARRYSTRLGSIPLNEPGSPDRPGGRGGRMGILAYIKQLLGIY